MWPIRHFLVTSGDVALDEAAGVVVLRVAARAGTEEGGPPTREFPFRLADGEVLE